MGKIKRFFLDLPLRTSMILYIIVFALIAILLSLLTIQFSQERINQIYTSYPVGNTQYYLANEDGELLEESPYSQLEVRNYGVEELFSEADRRAIDRLQLVSTFCAPVYSAVCLLGATYLFYHNKLRKPFSLLQAAHDKVSENDLDFSLDYTSKDEMGELCGSFEKMRASLAENNRTMWRQMEARKRLNAAFAHDLRTPLTVLKGYAEMQQLEEGDSEVNAAMSSQIHRLERYVESMSTLQKFEDFSLNAGETDLMAFGAVLGQAAAFICEGAGKRLTFRNEVGGKTTWMDREVIAQVVENLVSNAARYAKSEVEIEIGEADGVVQIVVTDDGEGFPPESLRRATEPYFSGEVDKDAHFGLGLYICKVLCQHHGGQIAVENTPDGGRVTATFRVID